MGWEYKGTTPALGKVYHKNRMIFVVYRKKLRLYKIPENKEMFPCHGAMVWSRELASLNTN